MGTSGEQHDVHAVRAVGAERHGLFDVGGARAAGSRGKNTNFLTLPRYDYLG